MRPSVRLDRHRRAVEALCARHEVANPRVFGSVLRGTDTEASDLDLLVDTEPGLWLACTGALQRELVALLGVAVDVATPEGLPVDWRDAVVAAARPLGTWTLPAPVTTGPGACGQGQGFFPKASDLSRTQGCVFPPLPPTGRSLISM